MSLPTNTTFAEEIKSDRLKLLNYFTMGVSATITLLLLTFGTLTNMEATTNFTLIVSVGIIIVGSLVIQLSPIKATLPNCGMDIHFKSHDCNGFSDDGIGRK